MSNPSTSWLPQVTEITDGQQVSAEVVNPVFDQLIQREQYLFDTINQLADKSVLIALNQPLNPSEIAPNPQVIQEGYLFVVSYTNNLNTNTQGVVRALSAFTNSYSTSFFSPANTSYTFGIVQNVNANNSVNVYLNGLINFNVAIDDPTYGMLDFTSPGVREVFQPGPYYLSRKNPGYITANPSGITVFIGYALNNKTFLLNPHVSEFSQLFANYQYDILDRPTGTPVYNSGSNTWSITGSDLTRLGWVDVSSLPGSYIIPSGAKFIYNIPATFTTDNADNGNTGSLSAAEEEQATELRGLLPPDPANFVAFYTNGVQQRYVSAIDTDGIYSIDSFGLWWYSNVGGSQPWSSDLPSGTWTPPQWPSTKGSSFERPRMYLQFAKFNPNLKNAVVTSLAPYPDGSANVLNIVNKYNTATKASTGDLYVQYLMPFASNVVDTSNPTAISDFSFNQATGLVTKTTIPVVSTLTTPSNSGITLTNDGDGNFVISQQGQGSVGSLDSLEPQNATLEFLGLNSYIRLKYNTSLVAGFIGKILLPKLFPTGTSLKIVVHAFGFANVGSTALNAGYSFQYACSTAQNSLAPASVKAINSTSTGTLLATTTFTTGGGPSLFTFPVNYLANTALVFQTAEFVIPAANIGPDTLVNFKVLQSPASFNPYQADVGILDVYWSLI